jgi:hypothetical protein
LAFVAGQHDIGGFVQKRPHPPIPAFRDAADVIDLPGLIPSWDEAQIGPDVSGSVDARGIVDCRYKRERGQLADAWDGHQPAACRRGPCHAPDVCVDRGDRRHHGSSRRD